MRCVAIIITLAASTAENVKQRPGVRPSVSLSAPSFFLTLMLLKLCGVFQQVFGVDGGAQ